MANEIKPEQVPASAADAAKELGVSRWVARDIVAAVINAWPDSILMPAEIILPLPRENNDEPNYAATSGAYCEFDIPKPTPPGGTVVPFNGITTLDIDADAVLRSPLGMLDTAIVAGIDKDGSEYFASSYGSVADTLFLLERFKKMLLEASDE